MTVEALYQPDTYSGNGSTTTFPITFNFLDTSTYVKASIKVDSTGVITEKTAGTHYNVSGSNVVFTAGNIPATGETVILEFNPDYFQGDDYNENTAFPSQTVETALDKLTLQSQRNKDTQERAIRVNASVDLTAFDTTLPGPVADKFIVINSAADGFSLAEDTSVIGGLSKTDGTFYVGDGTTVVAETGNTARTSLGVGTGDSPTFTNLTLSGATSVTPASNDYVFIKDASDSNKFKICTINDIRGYVSVKDYGAVGDGATDDTAAIQAAIDAVGGGNGGVVFFPAGTYKVTAKIDVDYSYVTLRGEGAYASVLSTTSATADIIYVGDGVGSYSHVYIKDMGFASTVTRTAGNAVVFDSVSQGGIRDFYTTTQYFSIKMVDSVLTYAENGYIVNPTATNGVGVYIDGGNDHNIANVLVSGNPASEPRAGVEIVKTGATWLDNVGGLNSGVGLILLPSSGSTIEHVFSQRCAWDSNSSHGVLIQANSGTTIRRCKFVQDWSATNTGDGVNITGAGTIQDLEFVAFRSYNNQQAGFTASIGDNIRIVGGTFSGNSGASSGTYNGITFGGTVGSFSVTGVTSGAVAGFSNIQGYGLSIGSSLDDYTVTGNNFDTNVTAGISNSSGYNATTKIVRDNIGHVSENYGVDTGSTTDGVGDITITHGLSSTPSQVWAQPNGVSAVYAYACHSITSTTFKVRFWNVAAAGAALTSFALNDIAWSAKL